VRPGGDGHDASADRVAGAFAVLADPTRSRILHALTLAEELCVCDLALLLGISQSALSHQLRLLRDRRVVARTKRGRVVYYRLADAHVRHVFSDGLRHSGEGGRGERRGRGVSAVESPARRSELLRRGLLLEFVTVGWNLIEGVIAVFAALARGSVALLGFGVDSFVESISGSVLIWRLSSEAPGKERSNASSVAPNSWLGFPSLPWPPTSPLTPSPRS